MRTEGKNCGVPKEKGDVKEDASFCKVARGNTHRDF